MKILLVSYYFAPTNTIAARRLTALARYLRDNGHEVRIITSFQHALPRDFQADLENIEVVETRSSPFSSRNASRATASRRTASSANRQTPGIFRTLMRVLRDLFVWPDKQAGWIWVALPAALRTARGWRPDLIYASSPPATCMVLGVLISKLTGIPWVCEIRDRWADDPYSLRPQWRKTTERLLERLLLKSARGIVAVSQTWADEYGACYNKPVRAIYSGFDPQLYKGASARPMPGLPLRLVYTGSVYAGRDPAPLWQALADVGEAARDICVEFYGARHDEVLPGALAHGVDRLVQIEEYVSHDRAVELQCSADVLLILQWDNPSEAGNMPGKLFEYLGAGRPILAMGYTGGEMARIIEESGAGIFSNDPLKIVEQINKWLCLKREAREVHGVIGSEISELTSDSQFHKLKKFLSGE